MPDDAKKPEDQKPTVQEMITYIVENAIKASDTGDKTGYAIIREEAEAEGRIDPETGKVIIRDFIIETPDQVPDYLRQEVERIYSVFSDKIMSGIAIPPEHTEVSNAIEAAKKELSGYFIFESAPSAEKAQIVYGYLPRSGVAAFTALPQKNVALSSDIFLSPPVNIGTVWSTPILYRPTEKDLTPIVMHEMLHGLLGVQHANEIVSGTRFEELYREYNLGLTLMNYKYDEFKRRPHFEPDPLVPPIRMPELSVLPLKPVPEDVNHNIVDGLGVIDREILRRYTGREPPIGKDTKSVVSLGSDAITVTLDVRSKNDTVTYTYELEPQTENGTIVYKMGPEALPGEFGVTYSSNNLVIDTAFAGTVKREDSPDIMVANHGVVENVRISLPEGIFARVIPANGVDQTFVSESGNMIISYDDKYGKGHSTISRTNNVGEESFGTYKLGDLVINSSAGNVLVLSESVALTDIKQDGKDITITLRNAEKEPFSITIKNQLDSAMNGIGAIIFTDKDGAPQKSFSGNEINNVDGIKKAFADGSTFEMEEKEAGKMPEEAKKQAAALGRKIISPDSMDADPTTTIKPRDKDSPLIIH